MGVPSVHHRRHMYTGKQEQLELNPGRQAHEDRMFDHMFTVNPGPLSRPPNG